MENLVDAVKTFREKRQQLVKPSLESLKAAYTDLLQEQKALETYLDDNSVPVKLREGKIEEFKAILSQLNQLLIDIVHSGHFLKGKEVLEGF